MDVTGLADAGATTDNLPFSAKVSGALGLAFAPPKSAPSSIEDIERSQDSLYDLKNNLASGLFGDYARTANNLMSGKVEFNDMLFSFKLRQERASEGGLYLV